MNSALYRMKLFTSAVGMGYNQKIEAAEEQLTDSR